MPQTLLTPFDGSPAAQEALRAACGLARLDQGVVIALYVVCIPRQLPLTASFPWADQEIRAVAAIAERIGQSEGVHIWAEWVYARSVSQAVLDVADELAADEIILGVQRGGRVPIWTWPWSTAAQILNQARRPVLLWAIQPAAAPPSRPAPAAST